MRFDAGRTAVLVGVLVLGSVAVACADPARTAAYKPSYLPPAELQAMLGARDAGGHSLIEWRSEGEIHTVEVRRNDSANLLLFLGAADDVTTVEGMVKAFDVAPRQISLEARIVEVDTDKARDLGIDWNALDVNASVFQDFNRRSTDFRAGSSYSPDVSQGNRQIDRSAREATSVTLSHALHLLEEQGAATTRDVPRILTLNNVSATILDGQRVTFTTKANGYTAQYVADTMDAGLKLHVTPSLVESGNLRLQLVAELTELANVSTSFNGTQYAAIGGSPIKQGQIVENTIMVKDGETIVLGGFTRTVDRRVKRRFPLLGRVLPWLFSRDIVVQSHHESLIAITPRVVDLANASPVDEGTKKLLEGH